MAEPAAALKLVTGRSPGKDKAGRPVKQAPAFRRTTPTKPEDLGPDGERLWDAVIAELPRIDRLKYLDGPSLEMACRTLDRWRDAVNLRKEYGLTETSATGQPCIAPWVKIEESATREFRAWCNEYGLTPSAELKLSTSFVDPNATPDSNPFG